MRLGRNDADRPDAWGWVTALGAFWGLSVAAAKVSLSAGMDPVLFAVCETAVITVLTSAVVFFGRIRFAVDRDRVSLWLVNGVFVVVIPYLISYTALTKLTAGEVTVVLALAPVLTSILAIVVHLEKWSYLTTVGTVVSLAGVMVVASTARGDGAPTTGGLGHGAWVCIAALSPLCYAIANVYVVSRSPRTARAPVANVLGTNAVGCALLTLVLVVMVAAGRMSLANIDLTPALTYLMIAALANASANLLFFIAARRTSASVLAVSGYLTTLFGIMFGIVIARDQWSPSLALGGALVVAGVVIGTWRQTTKDQ